MDHWSTRPPKRPPILSDNTSPLYIGRDASTGRYSNIDFGEILIVGGTLADTDRQRIEGYLAHKWSLADSLPQSHSYVDNAPAYLVASAMLNGSSTDTENDPMTHVWSLVSGPAAVAFADSSSLSTTATFSQEGVYTLRLTSGDGFGSSYDDVVITVGNVNPFETWAGDDGVTFTGDANRDGVADGMAWLLGAVDPADDANSLLPTAINNNGALESEFKMLNQAKRGAVVLKLQYGTDLGTWTTVTVPEENGTHDGVEFVINPVGDLNEVKATVPSSAAGTGARLFMRLSGE